MERSLQEILHSYNDKSPLEEAYTIPASWYVDERVAALERRHVFGGTWQVVARAEQVQKPGQFVTTELAGEPLVVVRGADGALRAFLQRVPASCGGGSHGSRREAPAGFCVVRITAGVTGWTGR